MSYLQRVINQTKSQKREKIFRLIQKLSVNRAFDLMNEKKVKNHK